MAEEQVAKRNKNRNQILRALHFEGPLRRSELSRKCGIRKSSVTSLICELLQRGLIAEDQIGSARSRLFLDSKRRHAVCASIKTDDIQFGRVYLDGRIEPTHTVKTPDSPAQILALLAARLKTELENSGDSAVGVGVAVRGIVDPIRGVGIYAANLPDWRQVPVKANLEEKLGVPVHVANDARCQLWAHAWFGRLLRTHANLLYLLFTEGVGSSSIVHNRIVNGATFAAGEIGHVKAGSERRLCRCGNYDCLETYAGLEALLAEIRARHPEIAQMRTGTHIVHAAKKFPDVDRIVDGAVQRCAVAVAWMWAMLEPEAVVIGSRDREFSELLRAKFIAHLRILGCEKVQDSRVLAAESEDHTMLQGIAGFIFESGYKNDQLSISKNGSTPAS